jgi:signal transduction protein with GAF and PtsI domain
MAIPLLSAEKLLGVLDVQSNSIKTFTAEDVSIFTSLAAQIAVALQNARQYSETQSALQQADLLYKGSDRVIRAQDPQMLLEAVVESASSNDFDQAFLIYFDKPWIDRPPDYLKVEGAWNSRTKGLDRTKGNILDHLEISLLGLINPNEPTVLSDIIADARVNPGLRDLFVNKLGMRSLVLFPLVAGGQLIGVITVQSADPAKQLAESSIRQIDNLAGQAATVCRVQNYRRIYNFKFQSWRTYRECSAEKPGHPYLAREERSNWGYEFDHIEVRPLES